MEDTELIVITLDEPWTEPTANFILGLMVLLTMRLREPYCSCFESHVFDAGAKRLYGTEGYYLQWDDGKVSLHRNWNPS